MATYVLKEYISMTASIKDKTWDFPKIHWHKHTFDDILAKGVTRNYNTKPYEKMHGPLREFYHGTNFRNVAPQV